MQANHTLYAVYHSVHDNFYWVSHFADPTFSHHLATGLVWIKLALMLSTEPVLPFDPRDYAIVIGEIFQNLKNSSGDILDAQGISLCELLMAMIICVYGGRGGEGRGKGKHHLPPPPPLLKVHSILRL